MKRVTLRGKIWIPLDLDRDASDASGLPPTVTPLRLGVNPWTSLEEYSSYGRLNSYTVVSKELGRRCSKGFDASRSTRTRNAKGGEKSEIYYYEDSGSATRRATKKGEARQRRMSSTTKIAGPRGERQRVYGVAVMQAVG